MTDRDHFAAAALTGLLVHAKDGIDEETLDTPSDIAYTAYAMADAMLRERCRAGADCPLPDNAPNHDAAPAARAAPSESSAPLGKGLGTGDTQEPHATPSVGSVRREGTEPVAWGVANGKGLLPTSISRIDAVDMQSDYACDTAVVPLYRSPTLTDAEREAINDAAYLCRATAGLASEQANATAWATCAATLHGLLERLGGGR